MKTYAISLVLFLAIIAISSTTLGRSPEGTPLKYISSCEADFNGDGANDIALLIEPLEGRELIVLLKSESGYEAYLLAKNLKEFEYMSCQYGNSVEALPDSTGDQKVTCKTPGAYIELYQPEGASRAFYWTGIRFKEVWLSD